MLVVVHILVVLASTVVLWYFYVPVLVHWYTGAGTRAGVAPKLALQAHKSSTLAATKPDNWENHRKLNQKPKFWNAVGI